MVDLIAGLADLVASLFDGSELQGVGSGHDIHSNPNHMNIWGTRPSNVQGTPLGNDGWGHPNNRR